jgi:DNA polymerase III subunit gamma/tau
MVESDRSIRRCHPNLEKHMEWIPEPLTPAPLLTPAAPVQPPAPAQPAVASIRPSGLRRAVLTAGVSALLLVGGAAAMVNAASPSPSAAPDTTAPSARPPAGTGHSSTNCPNMCGSNDSGGTTTPSPATPAPTPAT